MRGISSFLAIVFLAGCSKTTAIFTVVGEPGAGSLLKSKTITAKPMDEKNMTDKLIVRELSQQLRRAGFKAVPTNGEVTMTVGSSFGGRGIESSFSTRDLAFGNYRTKYKQMDLAVLDFKATLKDAPIWEARISGNSEYLLGDEYRGGCIRELFVDLYTENNTAEDRCFDEDEH